MQRPWCVFFELVQENAKSRTKLIGLAYYFLAISQGLCASLFSFEMVNPGTQIEKGGTIKLQLKDLPDGKFELREISEQDSGVAGLSAMGWILVEHQGDKHTAFEMGVTKEGDLTLPSLQVVDEKGDVIGTTQPFNLHVGSSSAPQPTGSPEALPEALDPEHLGLPKKIKILLGLMVGALAVLLVWSIIKLIRRPSKRKMIREAVELTVPEDIWAVQQLEQLENKKLTLRFEFKPHYFGISEILKTYFGKRYGFDAQESTSRELIARLEQEGAGMDTTISTRELFEILDRVKFTDFRPDPAEGLTALKLAREIVVKTKRTTPPVSEVKTHAAQ